MIHRTLSKTMFFRPAPPLTLRRFDEVVHYIFQDALSSSSASSTRSTNAPRNTNLNIDKRKRRRSWCKRKHGATARRSRTTPIDPDRPETACAGGGVEGNGPTHDEVSARVSFPVRLCQGNSMEFKGIRGNCAQVVNTPSRFQSLHLPSKSNNFVTWNQAESIERTRRRRTEWKQASTLFRIDRSRSRSLGPPK